MSEQKCMQDKNGNVIKAGDMLFNPYDRDKYHTVLQDGDGRLYLGDFNSPLERYAPQVWWEVVQLRSSRWDEGINNRA